MERNLAIATRGTKPNLLAGAVDEACFIRSGLVLRTYRMECTPFEAIHGKKPDVRNFRKFG